MGADAALAAFLAWLEEDYLAPALRWIASDKDIARGHTGSYG